MSRKHMIAQDGPCICPTCGYSLRGLLGGLCPECGEEPPPVLRGIPASALLPWERGIRRSRLRRFVATCCAGCVHYVRHLRVLRIRGSGRVHAERQLVALLLVAAGVSTHVGYVAVSFLHNVWSAPTASGILRAIGLVGRTLWTTAPLLAAESATTVLELVLMVIVLCLGARLGSPSVRFVILALAIGPPYVALKTIQVIVASVFLRVGDFPDWANLLLNLGILSITAVVLPVVSWLALRILAGSQLLWAVATSAGICIIDVWLIPFITREYMQFMAG